MQERQSSHELRAAIDAQIAERRNDSALKQRLAQIMEQDRELLERLAK
jgi:hypothetical protein